MSLGNTNLQSLSNSMNIYIIPYNICNSSNIMSIMYWRQEKVFSYKMVSAIGLRGKSLCTKVFFGFEFLKIKDDRGSDVGLVGTGSTVHHRNKINLLF